MKLITRSDFDGLACGALLLSAGIIDSWEFIIPDEAGYKPANVTKNDILANMPFTESCGLWFDRHSSEQERQLYKGKYKGESGIMPSTARIIYEYYGGRERFPNFDELMEAVDKISSGNLTRDEILNPKGWILIGFIIDPITGVKISDGNDKLMEKLLSCCSKTSVKDISEMPEIKERIELYKQQNELFKDMIHRYTRVVKDVIITDLRGVTPIYTGSRFIIYSLYPEQNISCWIADSKGGNGCLCAVGYSTLNITSKVNVGNIMLKYGGEGYITAGLCRFTDEEAVTKVPELLKDLVN